MKLKNKSELDKLYKETQKLYETLTVLKFYQDNFESVKNEVEASVLEEKLAQHFEAETSQIVAQEENPAEEPAEQEAVAVVEEEAEVENEQAIEEAEEFEEPALEEEPEEVVAKNEPEIDEEEPVFKPIFELTDDEEEDDIEPAETASEVKPDTKHVALEDLLGENYVDPVFVKPNEVSLFATETFEETTEKPASLNIASSKTIEIGLNDRVAFVNNLFGESNEDFNRVISQLNTFDTLEEAKTFLNEMVIPDYDYWVGKEDYVERFMEVVEKKFA